MGEGGDNKDIMRIEVIISAMNVETIDFYKKFNIESDCLIINQAGYNAYEEKTDGDYKIRMITTDTKGSGTSRNIGLLNSTADIIVFADDDEVFEKGYVQKIKDGFISHPDVDFFVFKTIIYQDGKEIVKVSEEKNLNFYNCLRYGSVHFVFKREAIERKNIHLSTYFGAGTENGSGEDSLFIMGAIKKGIKVRTNTDLLARVYNDGSTWFRGFDEKYFYDKGKLSRALFPKAYRLYIEYFVNKKQKGLFDMIKKDQARKLMLDGANDFGG